LHPLPSPRFAHGLVNGGTADPEVLEAALAVDVAALYVLAVVGSPRLDAAEVVESAIVEAAEVVAPCIELAAEVVESA